MNNYLLLNPDITVVNGIVSIYVDKAINRAAVETDGYRVIGTIVLGADFELSPLGTPVENQLVTFYYEAVVTLAGNNVIIFGSTMPANIVNKYCKVECLYNGVAWIVNYYISVNQTDWVTTADIENLAVTNPKIGLLAVDTPQIAAEAVTNAEMAQMPTVTIKGNDGAGPAIPQDLTMTELRTILAQFIQITGSFTSGPVVENPATGLTILPVTITPGSVGTADLANSAVTKIKLAASSVDSTKVTYGAGGPITVGPVTSQFILPGTFKALLDGAINPFFTLETGDILLNVQVFVGAASGVVQTISIGFDAVLDFNGTGASTNGLVNGADSNVINSYQGLSSTYSGSAFRAGNLIALGTGDLTVMSSVDLTATGIVAYAIITYMHA